MYDWRKMSAEERREVLRMRQGRRLPWHSPPRLRYEGAACCIFTAACYEHQPVIGKSAARLAECEAALIEICGRTETRLFAWCVLPNHYHLLIRAAEFENFKKEISLFHGWTARRFNLEDGQAGRKVWCNFFDRRIKSERHFWASLNYINHNPVRHGYAESWADWAFSGARDYLENIGKEKAAEIWREYPVLDYGKDWDVF